MSNWGYVAIAYAAVWGSLVVYAIVLARRVARARQVAHTLRQTVEEEQQVDSGTA